MINRISPPAIWKSRTVIPSTRKITAPKNKKSSGTPPPKPRKIAANPTGSMATKSGMNALTNASTSGGMKVGNPDRDENQFHPYAAKAAEENGTCLCPGGHQDPGPR